MKICDICMETVEVLYPMVLWKKGSTGDVCPNCVPILLKEKKGDSA